jgi:hypothetical protein
MNSIDLLIFLCGSLFGCLTSALLGAYIYYRKREELHDELTLTRETIRRNAYARGYEDARVVMKPERRN